MCATFRARESFRTSEFQKYFDIFGPKRGTESRHFPTAKKTFVGYPSRADFRLEQMQYFAREVASRSCRSCVAKLSELCRSCAVCNYVCVALQLNCNTHIIRWCAIFWRVAKLLKLCVLRIVETCVLPRSRSSTECRR